jgi:hypothetical protein
MAAALAVLLATGGLVVSWNASGRAPSRAAETSATAPPPGAPAAPATPPDKSSVPRPDATGHLRIPVSDRPPARLPADGVPLGWELKEFDGRAAIELVRDEGRVAVRLRSDRASFALYRDVVVDVHEYPLLTWSWKVTRLPASGDVREQERDDQAAQVYVVFPRWPAPRTNSDVIGYVWDSRAPVGVQLTSRKAENVRVVVVDSGPSHLGTWQTHERDVARDYVALFGRQPPRAGKVALMIDSNDTRDQAEALVGDLVFARRR